MAVIVIDVLGMPAAKGSPHSRVHNGVVVMHEGAKVKSWESLVREQARAALNMTSRFTGPRYVDVPLSVGITFRLTRPSGHWGKKGLKPSALPMPSKKPDIDKLTRATLDPMIGSIFDDDSRIVHLAVVKTYASPGDEGARIVVKEWKP